MKVCYFGIYDKEYSRNKALISGLRVNGVEVFECSSRKSGFVKYRDLISQHKAMKNNYDVMIVGYPGFQSIILAKIITRKPIVFDAFVSIYDSMVLDRGQVRRGSLKALYLWCLDKIALSLADVVLFDTNEHIKYVSTEFGIKQEKFRRIFFPGSDPSVFHPRERNNEKSDGTFRVFFYGHYIPLQGIEYIVRSAKLLESHTDITFEIVGDGPDKRKILELSSQMDVKNISFTSNVSLQNLSEKMSDADVCLGIFGNTGKTQRVIPNKVYDAVAMKKPLITADTPAVRELFSDNELFLTEIANPESLADKIVEVKSNSSLSEEYADRAFHKLKNTVTSEKLGLELKNIILQLI